MRPSSWEEKTRRLSDPRSRIEKNVSAMSYHMLDMTDGAYRTSDVQLLDSTDEGQRHVPHTLVQVLDHVLRLTLSDSHVVVLHDRLGPQVVPHRPPDDPETVFAETARRRELQILLIGLACFTHHPRSVGVIRRPGRPAGR